VVWCGNKERRKRGERKGKERKTKTMDARTSVIAKARDQDQNKGGVLVFVALSSS